MPLQPKLKLDYQHNATDIVIITIIIIVLLQSWLPLLHYAFVLIYVKNHNKYSSN